MLRIFKPVKIQRLRPGLNPQTWVPEASMLTTRPPKPSSHDGKKPSFYSRVLMVFIVYVSLRTLLPAVFF